MQDSRGRPLPENVAVVSHALYWGFWLQATKWAAKILASVIVVRMLGKEQYGLLSVVKLFVSYLMILYTLCLDQGILRYLPEIRTLRLKGGVVRFLARIFSLQTALWGLFLGIVLFFSEAISARLGGGIQGYLGVAVALSLFSLLQLDLTNALTTFYKVKTQVVSGAVAALILLVLLYGALRQGWGILGIFFAEAVVAAGLSFLFFRRVSQAQGALPMATDAASPIPFSRVLKFSFPYVCMTLLNQLIWRQSELFFLAHYETPAVVGVYNVGFALPQLALEFVPSFLGSIGIVGAVEQFIKGVDRLSAGIAYYYKILFFLLAPLITAGALFSDRLIFFLYGPEFALSGVISRIYSVVFLNVFILVPYGLAAVAEERIWLSVALSAPFCLLNLLLDFWWIKQFGIWGAVLAVSVIQVTGFLVTFFCWRKVYPYVVIPWKFMGKCFLATVPFFVLLPFKGTSEGLPWFLFLCLLMGGSYLWCVRWTRLFGPEDLELLERSRVPGKEGLLKFLKV